MASNASRCMHHCFALSTAGFHAQPPNAPRLFPYCTIELTFPLLRPRCHAGLYTIKRFSNYLKKVGSERRERCGLKCKLTVMHNLVHTHSRGHLRSQIAQHKKTCATAIIADTKHEGKKTVSDKMTAQVGGVGYAQ